MMIRALVLSAFVFSSGIIAQATENVTGWWLGTFSKKEITSDVSGWMETQVRYSFEDGNTNQILYRTGLLYKVSDHELGLLYGVIQTGGSLEHRATLQDSSKITSFGDSIISYRARLEGRFFRDNDNDSYRARFLIRYNNPINDIYSISVWNESFVNLSDEKDRGQDAYERNRFFIGFGAKVFKIKTSFGYLNQYVPREGGDTSEHLLVTYWNF